MSSYPPPSNNGSIYNNNAFIGREETSGGTKLVLDLSNYVRSDAGTFSSDLETERNLIIGNETQTMAYTNARNASLLQCVDKTTDISYANSQTTIAGDCQISGDLLLTNSIPSEKVSGLTSKLSEIDTNLANINSNDLDLSALQTFQSQQQTKNISLDTEIADLEAKDTSLDADIANINSLIGTHATSIATLNTNHDTQQTLIDDLEFFETTQITKNTALDASVLAIETINTAQDTRLTALETYDAVNDTVITALQTKDDDLDNDISAIETDITALQNADLVLQTNITSNDNDITALTASIGSINSTLASHTSSIGATDTLTASHKSSIAVLDGFKTSQESYNTTNDTLTASHSATITSHSTDIATNTSDIATKEPIISSSNRLNSAYIGDGSVSNLQFQTLAGIATGSSIESRFTTINNTLNSLDIDQTTLENLQAVDLTNFANIGTQITALEDYDTANDTAITNIELDITTLQTNVASNLTSTASNTGRLNVFDTTFAAHTTDIAGNTSSIATNTSDIGTLQSDMTTAQSDILTKEPIISSSNRLGSDLVSTNVDSSSNTLDIILQSLTDINTNQSTTITNINSTITSVQNQIASNDTELLNLQNQDTTHSSEISTLQGQMTTANTNIGTKQDTIDAGNKLSSALVYDTTELDTIDNIIVRIDTDIATKQDIIDTNNKLSIANVDITSSNIQFADYGSSISTKLTALDGQISTLTTLQNGDVANFTAIDDNFTLIEGQISTLQSDIVKVPYLDNVTSDVQNQIDNLISSDLPSVGYDTPTTTTTIANTTQVSTLKFSADASLQTTAFTSAKDTALSTASSDIGTLQSDMTTAQSDISSNTTAIGTKQDVLNNSTNKLPADHLDLSLSNLQYADYGSSINTKMNALDAVNTSQGTLNTSFTNDISTLTSGKQDVINGSNELNPLYIDAGTGSLSTTKMQYLSSITSDLQTQLDAASGGGGLDANNSALTGTTTAQALSMSGLISSFGIAEKFSTSATWNNSAHAIQYDFANGAMVYFNGLGDANPCKLTLSNVPTTQYTTQTFSILIDTSTHKSYCSTIKLNGNNNVGSMVFNGGASNVDVSGATGMVLQQVTFIFLTSTTPWKMISNVTSFA